MGRRKIAIQPITHERNRSVTFLKRKTGLFKKAYELGVLCSVDVAVIIFEERPGHNVKLYQYCSSDINEIVQRHIRHDGEKDTRGPADFSDAPILKFEDLGDGDEDEGDDDDELQRGMKRNYDGKIKSGDSPVDVDLGYTHLPPPTGSTHGMNSRSSTNASSLPVSSDRHSNMSGGNVHHPSASMQNKKLRLVGGNPTTGSSSGGRSPGSSYPYLSPTSPSGFGRSQHGGQDQFNGFFSAPTSTTSPTFSGPYDGFNSTSSRGHSGSSRSANNGTTPSYPPRNTSYDAALYPPMMRQQHPSHGHGGSAGGELFPFLDTDNARSRPTVTSGNPQTHLGTNLDWPIHGGSSSNAGTSTNPNHHSTSTSTGAGENAWLDFLSNNPAAGNSSGGSTTTTNTSGRRGSDSMAWDRGPSSRNTSVNANVMSPPLTRSMAAISSTGTGNTRSLRSRLSSSGSGGEDEISASGGNGSGIGSADGSVSIKQEKDGGG